MERMQLIVLHEQEIGAATQMHVPFVGMHCLLTLCHKSAYLRIVYCHSCR